MCLYLLVWLSAPIHCLEWRLVFYTTPLEAGDLNCKFRRFISSQSSPVVLLISWMLFDKPMCNMKIEKNFAKNPRTEERLSVLLSWLHHFLHRVHTQANALLTIMFRKTSAETSLFSNIKEKIFCHLKVEDVTPRKQSFLRKIKWICCVMQRHNKFNCLQEKTLDEVRD